MTLDDGPIAVLGSDGYTGWALTCHLLDQGYDVVSVDDFTRRTKAAPSVTPIADHETRAEAANEAFEGAYDFHELDIADYDALEALLSETAPSAVANLAQIPTAPYSMISVEHAWETQQNNIEGALNLMWALRNLDRRDTPIVQLATMGEYGTPEKPLPEGFLEDGRPAPKSPGSLYHACYDDETEILTREGWKPFADLAVSDEVMSMDSETGVTRWTYPEAVQDYDYSGDLVTVENRSVDLAVTPNHRMLIGSSWANGHDETFGRRTIVQADELGGTPVEVPCFFTAIPEWNGKKQETFTLPGVDWSDGGNVLRQESKEIPMEAWVRFVGWWLSEGSVGKQGQTNTVTLYQNDVDPLVDVFESIGYDATVAPNTNGELARVNDKQLAEYLRQLRTSEERHIPAWMKDLSVNLLDILLSALIDGDGTQRAGRESTTFYTSSRRLADDVQEIALKTGRRATIALIDRSDDSGYQQRPEYRVNIAPSWAVQTNQQGDAFGLQKYGGKVYCCTVDGGVILVRRNGKPVWCGNSKVNTTVNTRFLSDTWDIPVTEIYQGIVYGFPPTGDDRLLTRFDVDAVWGTVLNRFTVQAAVGEPLTVYGQGGQKRAMLPIDDCIRCLTLALENPPGPDVPGRHPYRAINQFDESYRVKELAEMVSEHTGAEIAHLENPRKEDDSEHFYEPDREVLDELGYEPSATVEEVFLRTYEVVKQHTDRIDVDELMPDVYWDDREAAVDAEPAPAED